MREAGGIGSWYRMALPADGRLVAPSVRGGQAMPSDEEGRLRRTRREKNADETGVSCHQAAFRATPLRKKQMRGRGRGVPGMACCPGEAGEGRAAKCGRRQKGMRHLLACANGTRVAQPRAAESKKKSPCRSRGLDVSLRPCRMPLRQPRRENSDSADGTCACAVP